MSRPAFSSLARLVTLLALLCVAAPACASQTPAPTALSSPEATLTPLASPATQTMTTPPFTATSIPLHLPTRTAVPLPTATATSAPSQASPDCPVVLFARNRDLWRTNLGGGAVERLTEGEPLDWQPGRDDWWVTALSTPIQVSPDGRWLTFFRERTRVLIDVTAHTQIGLPMSHATVSDWSPDSRYFAYGTDEGLYRYDVREGKTTQLVNPPLLGREGGVNVGEVVWSPDGRFVGFACCFASPSEEAGASVGQVWELEVATGQVEMVGEIEAYVSRSNPLCWTAEGQLAAEGTQGVRCSQWGLPAHDTSFSTSPDGAKQAVLGPSSPDDPFWSGPTRLTVSEAATGEVLWQREISGTIRHVTWSPDGQYLLLDDDLDRSPIWRTRSDGSGGLEPIIEDGFLVGVISQWCQPPAGSAGP